MSAIILRWTDDGGDLALGETSQIVTGHPLVTEMLISLRTDAPADVGDPAPEGVSVRGNWQRSFDPAAIKGSKLWMARYVRPIARAVVLVPIWATEATQWMITTKRAVAIDHTAARVGFAAILLTSVVTIDAKTRREFVLEIPYVV